MYITLAAVTDATGPVLRRWAMAGRGRREQSTSPVAYQPHNLERAAESCRKALQPPFIWANAFVAFG